MWCDVWNYCEDISYYLLQCIILVEAGNCRVFRFEFPARVRVPRCGKLDDLTKLEFLAVGKVDELISLEFRAVWKLDELTSLEFRGKLNGSTWTQLLSISIRIRNPWHKNSDIAKLTLIRLRMSFYSLRIVSSRKM